MIGSALGDAIGELAFQFPREELLLSELDRLAEVRYTDDTAMALGLAESIIEKGTIDEQHLGKTFSDNFEREPWRGYASGPPTVFYHVKQTGNSYSEAAQGLFGGGGSFGNGAAMRIGPVGLFFHDSPDLYDQACASSKVTHAHPVGMDGAAVQAYAVAMGVNLEPDEGFPLEPSLKALVDFARTTEIREKMRLVRKAIGRGISPKAAADAIGRTVAVQESMPFAVYSFFRHAQSFEDCLLCAIMNGGDRDTLGAMAGAISGAYLGIEAISPSWCRKLENLNYIEELASRLAEAM
jgi:poly(ADP-ribose) glycohydrolase ARH3